jgi:hypothetical protein
MLNSKRAWNLLKRNEIRRRACVQLPRARHSRQPHGWSGAGESAKQRSLMAESAGESAGVYRLGSGQVLPVLWESVGKLRPEGWEMSGLTANYLRVYATASTGFWNTVTLVKLTGMDRESVLGTLALE